MLQYYRNIQNFTSLSDFLLGITSAFFRTYSLVLGLLIEIGTDLTGSWNSASSTSLLYVLKSLLSRIQTVDFPTFFTLVPVSGQRLFPRKYVTSTDATYLIFKWWMVLKKDLWILFRHRLFRNCMLQEKSAYLSDYSLNVVTATEPTAFIYVLMKFSSPSLGREYLRAPYTIHPECDCFCNKVSTIICP